ncbi:MAG: YidC/Oxa1 family membrane protein insertase [Firmicutes bacterium]|nr:YidC/Oxa1 family membrane protein insertase [Bacillota bacterium]
MGGIWSGFLDVIRVAFEFFTHLSGGNYVIGIILLTLAVRVVLLPLGITQARSMQIAKLYKEEGVNPASGCLPLLLQIPVMYGLFDVLRSFKYQAHHGLWIWQNLAVPDHTYVLPVLVAASTFFMQKQTMAMTPQQPGMEASQKMMLWMMPIIFGYVASKFPAGLSIYYVVSNLFQVVQTTILLRKPIDGAAGGAPAKG